jgi:phosphoribosylformimino-5-aminoimidazole carboxamide ribotide isomerase
VDVIPVIDLKAGQVVHAQRGHRDSYQPVQSHICRGSEPLDVVAGILAVFPFRMMYIADLDAIQGYGDNIAVIRSIRQTFSSLRLWVDNGLNHPMTCRDWLSQDLGDLVLGSEVQRNARILGTLAADEFRRRVILSLDYKDGRFLGPTSLLAAQSEWPDRIIVMTLSRVGSAGGPDLDLLRRWRREAPTKQVFAAGGVRGGEDLLELANGGISGVLVATALHEQRIASAEIAAVSSAPAST